jgi:hypothetical protein
VLSAILKERKLVSSSLAELIFGVLHHRYEEETIPSMESEILKGAVHAFGKQSDPNGLLILESSE